MPGVAFDLSDPANVGRCSRTSGASRAVVTYGRPRWMAWYMGDPPRKIVTRYLRRLTGNTRARRLPRLLPPERRHPAALARFSSASARPWRASPERTSHDARLHPPHRFLPYLSWTEIAALPDRENTVIVLPVGAIEQHGPHLPCSVDSVISSGVLGKALEKLPAEVRAFGMAPITYGKSDEHLHFPGTMTLTGPTLLATVTEIGESVYRAGFRKLLLANGHGGQPQVLEMAARELRLRHGDFLIVPFHVSRLPNASGKYICDEEKRLAMHAGHSETALMMALAPDTVHMERAVANYPAGVPLEDPVAATAARPAPGPRATSGPAASSATRWAPRASRAWTSSRRFPTAGSQAITDLFRMQLGGARGRPGAMATSTGHIERAALACAGRRPASASPTCLALHPTTEQSTMNASSIRDPHARLSARRSPPLPLAAAGAAGAGQVHLHDQLVRAGRARRLLPGGGHRHLQEVRPRRHHQDGRAAGQHHAAAGRRPGRLHHGLERPADDDGARAAACRSSRSPPSSRRTRRC